MRRIILFISILVSCSAKQDDVNTRKAVSDDFNNKYYKVTRIIDGDTFEIEGGERVRIIGIDTPEKWDSDKLARDSKRSRKDKNIIKALGFKSTMYTDSILYHQLVFLKSDSTNSNRDKYNRLLRYVYLQDSILFNLKIIVDGYAFAYTKYDFIYMEKFRNAESTARKLKKGLWSNRDFEEMDD